MLCGKLNVDKILHQLCTFHALKNLSKAVADATKSIKNRGLRYTTDHRTLKNTMKLVFSLDNQEKMEVYLKRLPPDYQKVFSEIINDGRKTLKERARKIFDYKYSSRFVYHSKVMNQIEWIHDHWDNLTHFYEMSEIPKTNNAVEQYYSYTHPDLFKRGFKNSLSLENHLFAFAYYQNDLLSLKT